MNTFNHIPPLLRAVSILFLAAAPLVAQSFYDAQGSKRGHATRDSQGNTSYYDANGRYQGRAVKTPTGTRYYDASGRYQGRAVKTPGQTH